MCRQNKEHSDNDEKLLQQSEHDETDVTPEELEKYVKVDIGEADSSTYYSM